MSKTIKVLIAQDDTGQGYWSNEEKNQYGRNHMEPEKIKFLIAATGLSFTQAGKLLGYRPISVRSWCSGARTPPPGVIDTLCEYHDKMMDWAAGQQWPVPDVKTDEEAEEHGFIGVNSYRIAASMVLFDNFRKKRLHSVSKCDTTKSHHQGIVPR